MSTAHTTEYVTHEELETMLDTRFREHSKSFEDKLAEFVALLRLDIENQGIIYTNEMKKQLQLQRLWFQEDMKKQMKETLDEALEKALTKQRLQFNEDTARHIGALTEEYQWRISAVGEKVDLIWEKCERKYAEIDTKINSHEEKLEWLGEFLPKNSKFLRRNKDVGRAGKKSN